MGLCLNSVASSWRNNSEFTLQDLAVAAALYNGTDANNPWYWEKVFSTAFPEHASLWADLNSSKGTKGGGPGDGYRERILQAKNKGKDYSKSRYTGAPVMGGGVKVGKPGKLIVP